ncbi:hypothetical protein M5X06_22200 [Paenibacillus alvei]|uniref:Uncharacterized protein n=1 Tax=Paenibacillus alvei TaxID=44250 RepID=A0ABT4H3I9_PAEAL|nr:hypothetical protein [Paenibacillus alvei]MCY9763209.1 hypothetical protein [Paenibacillus alvei]MCY9769502.1 hypothetical protein [Paenibacillus alvei]
MDRNAKHRYWLVQLGELYYAGELARISPVKNAFSYEFVSDEALALPFNNEVFADQINAKCGGIVTSRETTFGDYVALYERHQKYTNSEEEFYKEQSRMLIDVLENEKH